MAYRVELSDLANADAYLAFERVREVAPTNAERWLNGLFRAISTLEQMPARCPVIPEADELGFPARHLIYGKRSASWRIIFEIDEKAQRVSVLRIWRGPRAALTAQDIVEDMR